MNHRHYALDCIHELEGQKLLSIPEKEALCEKISRTVNRPSAALVVLVKVLPFFAVVLLFAGLKLTETTVLGWGVLIIAICYLAAALFLYLVKEVWVYDRWKETSKTIMKQDVYAVPVEAGQVWEAGDKTGIPQTRTLPIFTGSRRKRIKKWTAGSWSAITIRVPGKNIKDLIKYFILISYRFHRGRKNKINTVSFGR